MQFPPVSCNYLHFFCIFSPSFWRKLLQNFLKFSARNFGLLLAKKLAVWEEKLAQKSSKKLHVLKERTEKSVSFPSALSLFCRLQIQTSWHKSFQQAASFRSSFGAFLLEPFWRLEKGQRRGLNDCVRAQLAVGQSIELFNGPSHIRETVLRPEDSLK